MPKKYKIVKENKNRKTRKVPKNRKNLQLYLLPDIPVTNRIKHQPNQLINIYFRVTMAETGLVLQCVSPQL